MFLVANSASAATAALGLAGYGLMAIDMHEPMLATGVALAAAGMMTILVAGGVRRSNWANALLVAITIGSLAVFIGVGMHRAIVGSVEHMTPLFRKPDGDVVGAWQQGFLTARHLLGATALMFVAYTGYGRIATLSEEVHRPRRTIPIAIIVTLAISVLLYAGVGFVAVASVGPEAVVEATQQKAAPLEAVAQLWEMPRLGWLMTAGAVTAMGGVLLNLLLGLSRVMLAMGRRRDMPQIVARLDEEGTTPWVAVLVVGAIVMGLVLIGDIRMTWSLSAFTVLIYYGITNLAAIRLPKRLRLYPAFVPWCGLISCLGLAACVNLDAMLIGLVILIAGVTWHRVAFRRRRSVIG
jgi:APA family basic amino acid/polyamine antiporter